MPRPPRLHLPLLSRQSPRRLHQNLRAVGTTGQRTSYGLSAMRVRSWTHSQPPHDLPEAKPTAACQIEHPTDHQATTPTQLLPPAHDVFWLRPQARLPDTAATLTRYEEERKAIFENPKKILPVTHLPRKDGEATSMPGSTLTCDQAWLRLQEAVCSRRRSGVKLEGGGGS